MGGLSLADLERSGSAVAEGHRLRLLVPTDWPAEGEKRIGYVSIFRLVESVRELHWRRDVGHRTEAAGLDSITRSLSADFASPILAGTEVIGAYAVTWVRPRSYGLRVTLTSEEGADLAQAELASVFIDPGTLRPVTPPPVLAAALRELVSLPGRHEPPGSGHQSPATCPPLVTDWGLVSARAGIPR